MHVWASVTTILCGIALRMAPPTRAEITASAHSGPSGRQIMKQPHCLTLAPIPVRVITGPANDTVPRRRIRSRGTYVLGRWSHDDGCGSYVQKWIFALTVPDKPGHGAQRWLSTADHTTAVKYTHTFSMPTCSLRRHTQTSIGQRGIKCP